tara:strand:+ start:583 stop:2061 length:1479 start_codon:yes stop_codon:yes gene_type:complete
MLLNCIPAPVNQLVLRIVSQGGQAFLVGGAVIDLLQGREPKDWDIEVFRLSYGALEKLFSDLNPKTVGKAFGIIKLTVGDVDIDLNVPRRDNKVGKGHTGFEVEVDPNMTAKEAARRRDFTINAMSLDLSTGDLIDPFGGRADLDAGILRATDAVLFVEDPLRALRAMQLLARKAKVVDPGTMALIRGMVDTFPDLPKERVYGEFRKLLLEAARPSVGFEFLRESGWLIHFPELVALVDCPQRAEWHPEGDVWTHSLLAADAMAEIRHTVPEHQREAFAFAVPLHDLGKPEFTITQEMMDRQDPLVLERAKSAKRDVADMLLTAHGHDIGGMAPAESFMRRITNTTKLIKLVSGIVGMHMRPWSLRAGDARKGGYARLHRKMQEFGGDLRLIGRMCQCDSCATGNNWKDRSLSSGDPNWEHESSKRIFDYAEEFDKDANAVVPKVRGRDLIAAGLKPGQQFGKILKDALDVQDSDETLDKAAILAQVLPGLV